jgi:hypothetical protein
MHNFAFDMRWLPWPVIPKKQWPKVRFAVKRAITQEEHVAIIARKSNLRTALFTNCAGISEATKLTS